MTHMVYVLWATPRSLSTVFERIIDASGAFEIIHEPLCNIAACGEHVHYRSDDDSIVFRSAIEVHDYVQKLSTTTNVFVKDTCEYDYVPTLREVSYLSNATHAFMLRKPDKAINSHFHINPQVTSSEIGYRHLAELHDFVRNCFSADSQYIDAERLVLEPDTVAREFFERNRLDYSPDWLSWTPQALPQWKRTAKWHVEASNSGSVSPTNKQYTHRVDNDERLYRMFRENQPYYEHLMKAANMSKETVRYTKKVSL